MKVFFVSCFLISALCFAHDDLSLQIQEVSKLIEQSPHDATLYLRRAELNRTDAHWKEAEQDYLKAKTLAPGLDATDLGLATLYYNTDRFDESLNALNRFLAKHPEHPAALLTRARIFKKTNKMQRALDDYSKSLNAQPDPGVFIERADLLLTQNRVNEALSGLNEGISTLGPVVTLELAAIKLDLQLKQYDSALGRVDQIASQAERKEIWLVKRAEILTEAGRSAEAKQNYLAALNSINTLSDSKRNTKATRELETKIQAALEDLNRSSLQ